MLLASCDRVISNVCNVKERESENEKCFEMNEDTHQIARSCVKMLHGM